MGAGGNIPSFKALSFPCAIHLWESPVAFRRDGLHLMCNLSALVKRSVLSRPLTNSLHNWRCPLFRPFARVLKKRAYLLATHTGYSTLTCSIASCSSMLPLLPPSMPYSAPALLQPSASTPVLSRQLHGAQALQGGALETAHSGIGAIPS